MSQFQRARTFVVRTEARVYPAPTIEDAALCYVQLLDDPTAKGCASPPLSPAERLRLGQLVLRLLVEEIRGHAAGDLSASPRSILLFHDRAGAVLEVETEVTRPLHQFVMPALEIPRPGGGRLGMQLHPIWGGLRLAPDLTRRAVAAHDLRCSSVSNSSPSIRPSSIAATN